MLMQLLPAQKIRSKSLAKYSLAFFLYSYYYWIRES